MQTRKRTGETANLIREHRKTELLVARAILVGIDDQALHLGLQTLDHPGRHWPSAQFDQPFVHAPHAAAQPPRQHHASHITTGKSIVTLHLLNRSSPQNNR